MTHKWQSLCFYEECIPHTSYERLFVHIVKYLNLKVLLLKTHANNWLEFCPFWTNLSYKTERFSLIEKEICYENNLYEGVFVITKDM